MESNRRTSLRELIDVVICLPFWQQEAGAVRATQGAPVTQGMCPGGSSDLPRSWSSEMLFNFLLFSEFCVEIFQAVRRIQ